MSVRSFSQLALVFVVLFATLAAGSIFPFEPLDPAWQSRLTATLLNAATLPLLALVLLQLASLLDPRDPLIQRQRQRFSHLAVAAALGFLLLLPLQISAALRLQASAGAEQLGRLDSATRKLAALRQAVGRANSSKDLRDRLQTLSGPPLSPADLTIPLPLLKAQVTTSFDQAQIEIARQRNAIPSTDPLRLLPELLRSAISCLAIACGFAIFAQWPGKEITLLEEVQLRFQKTNSKRLKRDKRMSQAKYLRQLHGEKRD
jgi:hypothetical protein